MFLLNEPPRPVIFAIYISGMNVGMNQPTLKELRTNAKDTETTVTNVRGGVELVKQAQQKQQRYPSYADYLRYKKAIPYVQNKGGK